MVRYWQLQGIARRWMSTRPLIEFNSCDIHRFGVQQPVFKNVSLTIGRDQRPVIVGPVSSGKTTLAEALSGKHSVRPVQSARWNLTEHSAYPSEHVHLVSFREDSSMFSYSKHYYQERFNFSDADNDITLLQFFESGQTARENIYAVAEQLDLERLLPLSFLKLSNGQTRRARLARALLRDPKLLVLDEPLMGLDVDHRQRLLALLGDLTLRPNGVPVVMTVRPQDEIPDWATDVIELDRMEIVWRGTPTEYASRRPPPSQTTAPAKPRPSSNGPPVVELRNVNVTYSGRKILDHISWTVRQGDRWALLGPNGSGKTTLLSLLTGDHPQAYANDLALFGRQRGTGESIWDIKQRIGLVSPEIHLYFNPAMTAVEAAGTGFFDVVVPRRLTTDQEQTVRRLCNELGLGTSADRALRDMSTGEQRLVLLARSLVKSPDLIIWDEPFQGLDDAAIRHINHWLEHHLKPTQTLILVTHHEDEIPAAVTQRFLLGPRGVAKQ